MTSSEFETLLRKWLRHKIILSKRSKKYWNPVMKARMAKIGDVFWQFIDNKMGYSMHQLSQMIIKHEDLLMGILPSANNPAYNSSIDTLTKLLETAKQLLQQ
jgi:hypothetical protein